jgi:hypothetical protein
MDTPRQRRSVVVLKSKLSTSHVDVKRTNRDGGGRGVHLLTSTLLRATLLSTTTGTNAQVIP